MPRRRTRFKKLNDLYRTLNGNIPPENTALTNYEEWRKGNRKVTINQTLTSEQRKVFGYAIVPFNLEITAEPTASDRYAAPITKYSNDGRQGAPLSLTDAELGYADIDGDTAQDDKFFPALIRVFVKDNAGGASTTRISGITGEEYKAFAGKSYSIPFGRTIQGDKDGNIISGGEDDAKKQLATKVKAIAQVSSFSYEPELIRTGRILATPTT